MFSCAVDRQEHCKQIHWCVWAVFTVSGPHWVYSRSPTECVFSQSTLLSLQIAMRGNCLKQILGCMHLPGLSCSDTVSQVLHKGTDSAGSAFCALPRSVQLRWPGVWWEHSPWLVHACLFKIILNLQFPLANLCNEANKMISNVLTIVYNNLCLFLVRHHIFLKRKLTAPSFLFI